MSIDLTTWPTKLLADVLQRRHRSSRWAMERDPGARAFRLSMTCRAQGSLLVPDTLLEDTDKLRIADAVFRLAEDLHRGVHRNATCLSFADVEPLVECRACGFSAPAITSEDMPDFEYCERQATLWMKLAKERQR